MKNVYLSIFFLSIFLSGCQIQQNMESNSAGMDTLDSETRQGDTTLTGKIIQTGTTFALVDSTGKQTEIDSYKVELIEFVDQEVSVTGQYSGDTLFVAAVDGLE